MEPLTDIDQDILFGFLEESLEALALAEQGLIRLETDPANMDHVSAVFRAVHSLKGNAAFFNLMRVKRLAHRMEDVLDDIRQGKVTIGKALIDLLLPGTDMLKRMLLSVQSGGPECDDVPVFDRILTSIREYTPELDEQQALVRIGSLLSELRKTLSGRDRAVVDEILDMGLFKASAPLAGKAEEKETPPDPVPQETKGGEQKAPAAKAEKTMRISEKSLDEFLTHVGELLGVEEMLAHVIRGMGNSGRSREVLDELKQAAQQFGKLSASLRTGIMDIRKVSPASLFGKVPRTVREIAGSTGKEVAVTCLGEEIRIDKRYADLLDAPLMHMVRNAVDHGIETPEERHKKGKDPKGRIRVELVEKDQEMVLTVSDDGKGLDREALGKKAREMGMIAGDAIPSEDEIIQLLFQSGVSTAREVTDISGRGVGMDVVKQSIEEAGGRISVDSRPDQGCEFSIRLPRNVSTRIMDGYLVQGQSGTVYVLPLKLVIEAFAPDPSHLGTVQDKGRIVRRRGMVYPLVDLEALICREGTEASGGMDSWKEEISTLVLIRFSGQTAALAISRVVGVQKIVVKPIEGLSLNSDLFEGAALMGDGHVALVVGGKGIRNLFDATANPMSPPLRDMAETV